MKKTRADEIHENASTKFKEASKDLKKMLGKLVGKIPLVLRRKARKELALANPRIECIEGDWYYVIGPDNSRRVTLPAPNVGIGD